MDPLSWALNAIDKVFSTRQAGPGEPKCPDGTFLAGYAMDSWNKWRVVCLSILEVEDVEDVFLFAAIGAAITIMGLGLGGIMWRLRRMKAEFSATREAMLLACDEIKRAGGQRKMARAPLNKIRLGGGNARMAENYSRARDDSAGARLGEEESDDESHV